MIHLYKLLILLDNKLFNGGDEKSLHFYKIHYILFNIINILKGLQTSLHTICSENM